MQTLRQRLWWQVALSYIPTSTSAYCAVQGNHDVTLDTDFYAEHGLYFHNQHPQDSTASIDLIKERKTITFLNHWPADVRLTNENGPRTRFRIFGSPYSPAHGLWAFGYPPEVASVLWDQIPLDTDIVLTHTPPKFHCDESKDRGAAGCEVLRQTLWRVRPRLAICGHVHEGRGAERILWDLDAQNVQYKELATGYWTDPGLDNKKQSLLDLSARRSAPVYWTGDGPAPVEERSINFTPNTSATPSTWMSQDTSPYGPMSSTSPPASPSVLRPLNHSISQITLNGTTFQTLNGNHSAVRGQGGRPPSERCDVEALTGRMDRKETCVVNAAIMARSWPYKTSGSRKYNKPIVVDINLPVLQAEEGGNALGRAV